MGMPSASLWNVDDDEDDEEDDEDEEDEAMMLIAGVADAAVAVQSSSDF